MKEYKVRYETEGEAIKLTDRTITSVATNVDAERKERTNAT